MICREALSVLRAIYIFIGKDSLKLREVWGCVLRGLRWMRSFIIFFEVDLSRTWSSEVYCFDASEWGGGILRSHVDPIAVRAVGQYCERWRFKSAEPLSMRVLASRGVLGHVMKTMVLSLLLLFMLNLVVPKLVVSISTI